MSLGYTASDVLGSRMRRAGPPSRPAAAAHAASASCPDGPFRLGGVRRRRRRPGDHGFSHASSTAVATSTSALFGIYRWGWGFSTSQGFNGDTALIACFASSWTPAMGRRWHADPFGFLRPSNELPALFGSAPPATPPRHGRGHLPDGVGCWTAAFRAIEVCRMVAGIVAPLLSFRDFGRLAGPRPAVPRIHVRGARFLACATHSSGGAPVLGRESGARQRQFQPVPNRRTSDHSDHPAREPPGLPHERNRKGGRASSDPR
jgi:hypothetical protein